MQFFVKAAPIKTYNKTLKFPLRHKFDSQIEFFSKKYKKMAAILNFELFLVTKTMF